MNDGWHWIATLGGAIAAIGTWFLCRCFGLDDKQSLVAATTALCAVWWCSEALPIPATALIPFVVFPIGGVLTQSHLATAYGDPFVLLFLAGFMLSKAAEKSRTHLQVARGMMHLVGDGSMRRIVLGFLAASAFCSMWISNTATALILLPVAIAVLERQGDRRLDAPLLLSVAYGSSVGGIVTLIGSPPNGIFAAAYAEATGRSVDFVSWFAVGAPAAAGLFVVTAVVLTWSLSGPAKAAFDATEPWTEGQTRVFLVFATTAMLWITRSAPFGGWSAWLDLPNVHDATVGLAAVLVMFLVPSGERDEKGRATRLLDWSTAVRIPWGVLLLFGGGLAIAAAFKETGLSSIVGSELARLQGVPPVVLIGVVGLTVTFLTEFTSNTATTSLLMPALAAAALGAGVDPAMLMMPAAISASCAFMLPIATPPNAIVFGAERVTTAQMAWAGLWLNLAGTVLVAGVCWFMLPPNGKFGQEPVETTTSAPADPLVERAPGDLPGPAAVPPR